MNRLFRLARPALFALSPERAHHLSIRALKSGILPVCTGDDDPLLRCTIAGLKLPNPLGMAAGYDKNAEVADPLLRLGFGFVEIGTVTPQPQAGNPAPRLFRMAEDRAIINRMGFNNDGHKAVLQRLTTRQRSGVVGVNIGANKTSDDFVADYVAGIAVFSSVADYFTVNISSPNTPGLRDLQAGEALQRLLDGVLAARDKMATKGQTVPVFLKIAPDLDEAAMDEIAAVANASALDGVIISNTTIDRQAVAGHRHGGEQGGLSGRPLFEKSTIVLARMRQRLKPQLPIIGVGGIDSAQTAIAKFEAGADLVQIYTGLVFQGPGLPARILAGLGDCLRQRKLSGIAELTGLRTDVWAAKPL